MDILLYCTNARRNLNWPALRGIGHEDNTDAKSVRTNWLKNSSCKLLESGEKPVEDGVLQ